MSEAAFGRARELASWKERVRAGFEGVHIDHIDLDVSVADIGVDRGAEAVVALGSLTPDDVEVQLLQGPVGQGEELADPAIVTMALAGRQEERRVGRGGVRTGGVGWRRYDKTKN